MTVKIKAPMEKRTMIVAASPRSSSASLRADGVGGWHAQGLAGGEFDGEEGGDDDG
jgi:hypothetical protein